MIGACPSTIAADALARDVLAAADCLITTEVQRGYASLFAPGGSFVTALTIALTIYVAIFGYRLLLGLSSLTLAEVVPHFIKIGVVVALATSWPSYQALVFETLFNGPEQLADIIVRQAAGPGVASTDALSALQAVFQALTDAAGDAWAQLAPPPVVTAAPVAPIVPGAAPVVPPPVVAQLPFSLGAPQFIAALLWLAAIVLMAASVGVLLVARIVLALLLLLGPVFVAFALFRATRGLAEGWLRVTVKFALIPLFALPLIAAVVAVLAPLAAGLGDAPVSGVRDSPVLLILLVVLVFAAVMIQAARLGGGIASGIRLPRRAALVAPPTPAPSSVSTSYVSAPAASRAETIVQAIDAGARRITPAMAAGAAMPMLATRAMTPTDSPRALLPDTGNRLGQSYRRLAVAPTSRSGS